MKIFVSIVSYRDPLLHHTLKSLMENKSEICDVVYGIFEQTAKEDSLETKYPELTKHPDVRYKRIDPEHSDGVCWARHVNSLQLLDEEFYYQIDSHMLFDKNWDRHLIQNFKLGMMKHQTDKIIITANCGTFRLNEAGEPLKDLHEEITCVSGYWSFHDNYILGAHGHWVPAKNDVSDAIHIFAGNFFTHTDWLKNVGFNPNLYFEGEEQYMVLSSFAAGYKLCHPTSIKCYHLTDTHNYITKQHINSVISPETINRNRRKSMLELYKFLDNYSDETYEEYRVYSGVDYINRKLETRAVAKGIMLPPDVVNDWEIPDRN